MLNNTLLLGVIHKRRPQSEGGGLVQYGHFSDTGISLAVDVRTFWCKKLRIFQNSWCVCTDKKVEPVRTFCRHGGRRGG